MIPWFKPNYWGKEKEYVVDAIESTWISNGVYVENFENSLAEKIDSQFVISTTSGTTALMLSYLTLGLGPGDEIIVPGYTFAAPANMALAIGATPVFAEVDSESWLMCPKSVKSKITSRTKAIVPVHIYGNMCDMNSLMEIAASHKIAVIEDAAEALFSSFQGQQAGTFGELGAFSFQATKTITTGEGGAVCTNDQGLRDMARLIRNHGMRADRRYFHEVVGHNFRLTNIQAALGVAQLERVEQIIENKNRVWNRYRANLLDRKGISMQKITDGCIPVIWASVLKINENEFGASRDDLIDKLNEKDIETRRGFHSFSDMSLFETEPLQNADEIARNVICLPSYAKISDNEIDLICEAILA